MTIASYGDLKTAVQTWMRRADLAAMTPDFITLAEAEMNRELKTSFQLVQQAFSIGAEFVAKPTGFRQLRTWRLTSGTGRQLREVTPEQMVKAKAVPQVLVAEPREFTAIGAQFEFWPIPDRTYTSVMEFQAGFTPLSDSNPSNWILADHPDAYLWGALAAASAFVKNDERAEAFQAQFMRVVGAIQQALRTSYDRTLRVDPALTRRHRGGTFNYLTGDA